MWSALFLVIIAKATSAKFSSSRSGTGHSYQRYGNTGYHSHSYPHSTGLSGNSRPQHSYHNTQYHHKTEVHHHYHYSPPNHVTYGSVSHPVYQSQPPIYVYEYRNSGSRFDNLLAGLALYNLGRMSANHHHYDSNRDYRSPPGEICKLGISRPHGEYEETRIDCKLISSFIWEAETGRSGQQQQHVQTNTVTTTVNKTEVSEVKENGTVTTSITVENKTVNDALQVKGPSIEVSPGSAF